MRYVPYTYVGFSRDDAQQPLTIAEAKQYLNVHGSHDDELIGSLIQSAIGYVQRRVYVALRPSVLLIELAEPCEQIDVLHQSCQDVASIKVGDQFGVVVPADKFRVWRYSMDMRICVHPDYVTDYADHPMEVRLNVGYDRDSLPQEYKILLRYIVNDFYAHRDNPTRDKATAADKFIEQFAPIAVG